MTKTGGAGSESRNAIVESRQFLAAIGAWLPPDRVDIEAWLENFENEAEVEVALQLLQALVHLNEPQLKHATLSAIGALSARQEFGTGGSRQQLWHEFLDRVVVTWPCGSQGDDVGSGAIFGRYVHETGAVPTGCWSPEKCVTRIQQQCKTLPLIFVDDLSATGSQFIRTWHRKVPTANGRISLSDLAERGQIESAYFVPAVATSVALAAIESEIPFVKLAPANTIDATYFASYPASDLVPAGLRGALATFLQKYSPRAKSASHGIYGYGDLGLALSFHHGTPNNAVPVLQRSVPGDPLEWKALLK
jgi:hypothetical protein